MALRLAPVVGSVFGVTNRGSGTGLSSLSSSGLCLGMSGELRSSSGQDRFHVFASVCMMRKLRAPK